MKNVTITMEEAALEWARIEAAKQGTSVSRLVGEMLTEKMQRTDAYQRAMHDWQTKSRLWKSDGQPYPQRVDIYDRGA